MVMKCADHEQNHSSGGVRWTRLLVWSEDRSWSHLIKGTIWAVTVCRPLTKQRARKKGVAVGSGTQGLWLKLPALCHWATTPTEPWCSSVAQHWRLKPEALGSTPDGNTFLSSPLLCQRSTDSDGPDCAFDETWSRLVFGPYEKSRPSDSSAAVILLMICTLHL